MQLYPSTDLESSTPVSPAATALFSKLGRLFYPAFMLQLRLHFSVDSPINTLPWVMRCTNNQTRRIGWHVRRQTYELHKRIELLVVGSGRDGENRLLHTAVIY